MQREAMDEETQDAFLLAGEGSGRASGSGSDEEQSDVEKLLAVVSEVCDLKTGNTHKKHALRHLSVHLRPKVLQQEERQVFVQRAMARGVVGAAVQLIELGSADLACAASNFLGDFAFNSDAGARAVLDVFDRIAACFKHIFEGLLGQDLPLLEAAVLLCVNIAASCPSGHCRLIPLVRPVCLQIIRNPSVSDNLRGRTIVLLANLSTTCGSELRLLGVGDALLTLIQANRISEAGRSVAESVVIFLYGSQACREIDVLVKSMDVIRDYCVPLLERTLLGQQFRGMYPHLLYSARLFQVLAQSREYAQALVANPRVVPLLLRVNCVQKRENLRVESDLDGRRLALEALWSLARFRLWPRSVGGPGTLSSYSRGGVRARGGVLPTAARQEGRLCEEKKEIEDEGEEEHTAAFLEQSLPLLLRNEHCGIRCSAVGLWATLNSHVVTLHLLVGALLAKRGCLPYEIWKMRVLACLYPFLCEGL